MVKAYRFLRGYVQLEICGAAPGWALNRLAEEKIAFWDILWVDALTVQVKVFKGREKQAILLAYRAMCDCKVTEQHGLLLRVETFLKRPVLLMMLFLCLMSTLLLPCFVFFYEVEGNTQIPRDAILRELHTAGIGFGTYGPSIYPKRVKDCLIQAIPELQWATVVQRGCRAVVVVREREAIPETQSKKGLANVVAAHGGIITKQSVYTGQAMFRVGDTVAEGDVLVSGVVDLDRTYLIERANAEVFANTWRKMQAAIPKTYIQKTDKGKSDRCIWLVVGNWRIKIFGNSGIFYTSCDRMIDRKSLSFPGGLTLPLALEIDTIDFYKEANRDLAAEDAEMLLSDYARSTIDRQMIAGEILGQSNMLSERGGRYELTCSASCHEMIARVIEAKWNNEDFLND